MRLDYIRSFVEVVNCRSFSRASKNLFLSQPTISVHIKQLESELDVELLVRSRKEVVLSEEGRIFYSYATRLLEMENKAVEHLKKSRNKIGGNATLAVSTSVTNDYGFLKFIVEGRKKNLEVNYKVFQGNSSNVIQKILNYDAEIGIGEISSGSRKICEETLYEDEIVIIAPNILRYRNMDGKFSAGQMKNEWFIMRETGSGTQIFAENILRQMRLKEKELHVAAQFESSDMVCKAVEEGMGIAFISRRAAKDAIDKQNVLEFPVRGIDTKRHIYMMYHKERALGNAAEAAIMELREYYGK